MKNNLFVFQSTFKLQGKIMKNLLNKSIKNVAITFGIFGLITTQIFAEGLFDSPSFFDTPSSDSGDNSFYKEDGSLVIIRGAKDSGINLQRRVSK